MAFNQTAVKSLFQQHRDIFEQHSETCAPIWKSPCIKVAINATDPPQVREIETSSSLVLPKAGSALPRSRGTRIEPAGRLPGRPGNWRTAFIYFGELIFAMALAFVSLAISTSAPFITVVLFGCGLVAFTLAEYIAHRFVLHAIAPARHRIHHARPQEAIDKIFWQIWLAFALLYLFAGGAMLAGVLLAYAWYLFVHYCAHHSPAIVPVSLRKHHRDHHRFANRNYGVTTKLWDRAFGTLLR